MTIEDLQPKTFNMFFDKYGVYDYCDYIGNILFRCRCYHDGGWLEGYDMEPVIYWGA